MDKGNKMTVKIVGLFGQSGAGKTSIIRSLPQQVNGNKVFPHTGIIRHLFNTQKGDDYINPKRALELVDINDQLSADEYFIKAQDVYSRYINSQFKLLNDFSAEVFKIKSERKSSGSTNQYLMFDRTPFDFLTVTLCGIELLKNKLDVELTDDKIKLLELIRKTAEVNTENFFDVFVITYPWSKTTNSVMRDGIRDAYLDKNFTGDAWYGKMVDFKLNSKKTKTITIKEDIITLDERVQYLSDALK